MAKGGKSPAERWREREQKRKNDRAIKAQALEESMKAMSKPSREKGVFEREFEQMAQALREYEVGSGLRGDAQRATPKIRELRIEVTSRGDLIASFDGGMTNQIVGRVPPNGDVQRLRNELMAATRTIEQQQAFINKLNEEPMGIGTVTALTNGGKGVVSIGTVALDVNLPEAARFVGRQVRYLMSTNQAVSVLEDPVVFGPTVKVERIRDGKLIFTDGASQGVAELAHGLALPEPGDSVRLDQSRAVVLANMGNDGNDANKIPPQCVRWEDIGGNAEAIEALREAVEYPQLYGNTYACYGQAPSKGALLYGPPGNGKTLLAKAVATSLGTTGFIYLKGAEILSKWVGEAEGTVRGIFERARKYREKTGKPAVIFIDEAEAILGVRGSYGSAISSTLVPCFLAEMDGLEESGAFVLLATNRPDSLDPAVVRDGRIDRRIHVPRPDRATAEHIFRLNLKSRPLAGSLDELVAGAVAAAYDDRLALYELGFGESHSVRVTFADALSGAAIAGIVRRAVSFAITRDRGADRMGGVTLADIEAAVWQSFRELSETSHLELIREKVESVRQLPTSLRKAHFDAGSKTPTFAHPTDYNHGVQVQAHTGRSLN